MRLADRIRVVLTTAGGVVQRFPAAVLLCLVGTSCAIWGIQSSSHLDEEYCFRTLFGCILGLPFSIGLTLATESSARSWIRRLPEMSLLLTGAFTVYFTLLPDRLPETEAARLATLILASHFSVAVLPFLRRPGDDHYWAFQVRLFLRFLLGALYAGVLFVGLALALLSLNRLLDLDIADKRYPQLWFLMAGIFHPLFTLGGIGRIDAQASFQASLGLRKFVQFVLAPLTALYLAILYLYAAKITVAWQLPNGWVGLPVLILSVVGLLGALLLHPWSADATNPWVRRFTRGFFVLTLPLTGLLALSIGVRIADYGVTESRYWVVLLTGWLVVVCLIRARQPHRDLRLIPASLLLLALLGSFGPWGASAWSLRSQQVRVAQLLSQLGLQTADGNLQAFVAFDDPHRTAVAQSLADTLHYLNRTHGRSSLPSDQTGTHRSIDRLLAELALDRLQSGSPPHAFGDTPLYAPAPLVLTAPFPARIHWLNYGDSANSGPIKRDGWEIRFEAESMQFIAPDGTRGEASLASLWDLRHEHGGLPASAFSFEAELTDHRRVPIAFESVNLRSSGAGKRTLTQARFLLALPTDIRSGK